MDLKFKLLVLEFLMEQAVKDDDLDKLKRTLQLRDELQEIVPSEEIETIVTAKMTENVAKKVEEKEKAKKK
tara:strand:+ start:42 stop:254 length:213 start_codon:yes stop_codon:yes gene_type:complete